MQRLRPLRHVTGGKEAKMFEQGGRVLHILQHGTDRDGGTQRNTAGGIPAKDIHEGFVWQLPATKECSQ